MQSFSERGNVTNNENKATRELRSRRINPESNCSSVDSRGKIWFSCIFRLLRDAVFSEPNFSWRRRGTISKYSNMKHMFEKYVRNDIGGRLFFGKLLPWMLFFYILYISIFFFGGGGGVVNLYCTLLTRKKVEWKYFRLRLIKYIPILKFSLDKDNKVRDRKFEDARGHAS